MVHSATTTHLAKDCLFAPDSKLNDGIIWLLVIEAGITRTQLLQVIIRKAQLISARHSMVTKMGSSVH